MLPRYLKPYWNEELKILHKTMSEKCINWISAGRQCNSCTISYKEYKNTKRLFRRVHRQVVDSYCLIFLHQFLVIAFPFYFILSNKVREDIDRSEVDSAMFCPEVNKPRKTSSSEPWIEMTFGRTTVKEEQLFAKYLHAFLFRFSK